MTIRLEYNDGIGWITYMYLQRGADSTGKYGASARAYHFAKRSCADAPAKWRITDSKGGN